MADEKKADNIFEELEDTDSTTTTVTSPAEADDEDEETEAIRLGADDFSDVAPSEKPKRENLDKKALLITEVGVSPPKTTDRRTGAAVPPTVGQQDASVKYYRGKLIVSMTDGEKKFVEYIPNVKYFVQSDGTVARLPRLPREGNNEVAKLFRLYADFVGKKAEEVSDKEFLVGLKGLKATITVATGTYAGRKWFRNDITKLEK